MVQSVPDKIEIIFENSDFLVVDKPSRLLVHSEPKENPNDKFQISNEIQNSKFQKNLKSRILNQESPTLTDWLKQYYPEIQTVGDDPKTRPGIVHRLDKETSGVMVIAKNQSAFEILKNKFKNREIKKTYLALVLGKMNRLLSTSSGPVAGEINLPIAKSKTLTKRTTRIRQGQKNSQAMTQWRLLKAYKDKNNNVLSLLEITPKTGRTHQIRVHLAAIGHPVCGDYLYGRKATKSFREKLPRIFLHAKSLEFYWDKSFYSFEAELPDELKRFLASLVEINE